MPRYGESDKRRRTPRAPKRDSELRLVVIPSGLALFQNASGGPPFYDRGALVIICVACVLAVVTTVIYPWSWRWLGLGLVALIAGLGVLFARALAGVYPHTFGQAPFLSWVETVWLVRFLLVGGSIGIIVGCTQLLLARPESWRLRVRRFLVFLVVCAIVRLALEVVHRVRG